MLMVIFGAGASYDSLGVLPPGVTLGQNSLPLADHLFDWRFRNEINLFDQLKPVVQIFQRAGAKVEQELQALQSQVTEDRERFKQLAAIRYYLQVMLYNCQSRWGSITAKVSNYGNLLDQIRHTKRVDDKVCLVTFNYDTLLEEAFPTVGVSIRSVHDYVKSDYRLIKLHGSVNWARSIASPNPENIRGRQHMDIVNELIEKAADLKLRDEYGIIELHAGEGLPVGRTNREPFVPIFPALTIPVESKQEYECPSEHLDVLKDALPRLTKLLIIGWRGAEKNFLNTLAHNVKSDTRVLVVSSSVESAKKVIENMEKAGVSANFIVGNGGFSHVVLSGETERFLTS